MRMKVLGRGAVLLLCLLFLAGCGAGQAAKKGSDASKKSDNNKLSVGSSRPAPSGSPINKQNQKTMEEGKKMPVPSMQIDKSKAYTATLKTSKGDIVITLNAKETPVTVNNFVYLAKANFYDNTIFHRVMKGFMIQGGDPKGDGTGGPGYKFDDEKFSGSYSRGTVAMANSGPNTNGSQFFIMHSDYPLPKSYVIFGKVSSGMDVVDAIAEAPVAKSPMGEMSKPVDPVAVSSVEIGEK